LRKCERLLLQAYEQAVNIFGPDHGEVGLVLMQLLDVCEKQGKKLDAEQYAAEIERIVRIYTIAAE